MRLVKIALATVIAIAVGLMVIGCGQKPEGVSIGISKIVAHPALDAVEQGIQDELAELGYEGVSYDLQSANGDLNAAASIANKFQSDKVDVAVGIATPTAQALANTIDEIPVVFTAVTDPVDSGLVPEYSGGGGNVTGYSDMTPVREQIELIAELGDIKAIGHVYSSGEANAVVLAGLAEEVCKELGIEFVPATVTNTAEVRQATQAIIDRVDAIYMSTDNAVVSALASLTEVAINAGVPVVTADPSSAEEQDVIAAYGFDYYTMGRATGRLIDDILEGKDPDSIPVQYLTDADDLVLHLNLDIAEQLGIDVPSSLIRRATQIVEDGELKQQ